MIGFGSFGGGGPSSSSPSSSNLSALAPPFTVDRSNSKPSTTSLLQFSESPYANSFGHTWQYANLPASRPEVYQKSELEADSTNFAPVTSASDYHFRFHASQSDNKQSNHWSAVNPSAKTGNDAFLFDPKVETYYPPFVSPVVNEGAPLVAVSDPSYDVLSPSGLVSSNASTQVDYAQSLSGLEYTPNWGSVGYGVVDAKRGKHSKLDGSFVSERSNASDSVTFTNYLNQGCIVDQCERMPDEDSGRYRQFSDVMGRESSKRVGSMEHADNVGRYRRFSDVMGRESSKRVGRIEHADNVSLLSQQVLSPFDSSSISSARITTSESLPPGPSLQSPKNFSNSQNPYNPYGKGNRPINSSFSTSVSVTKSSPTLVIRPPPVGTGLALQKSSSGQSADVDVAFIHQNAGSCNKSPARGKEPQVLQNREGVEGSFTSSIKNHKDETDGVFSLSLVVEGAPNKVQNKDTSNPVLRMNSGSQSLNVNASDGFSSSVDSILAIKSSENFTDCLDHFNPAVDSPCWKGAPASHFAPFDAVQTNSSHDVFKKLDDCHLQIQPPLPPLHDPIRSPSEKAAKDKAHHEYGSAYTERIISDMQKGIPILTSSKGVQFCEESCKAGEEFIQLNHSKSDSLLKFSDHKQLDAEGYNFSTEKPNLQDAVMGTDPTEGAVAVRTAENVLSSPSSEESASEQVKPHNREASVKVDVETLINTMCNLSDLLLFSCSSDKCTLKEHDHEALKHVISNLDSLLSQRMVIVSQGKEPILSQQLDSSENVVEYRHPHKSTDAGKPQLENKAPLELQGQPDYEQDHHKKKSASFQHFPSLMTELDVLDDDNVSQAIKKVLDENSDFGEEEHSQALLFKSLWLEAEAKLYSISYRARFDRMKIEMERLTSKQVKDVKENIAAPEQSSKSETFPVSNTSIFLPPDVEKASTPKTSLQASSSNADDIQGSFMAQLHMLSCRDDTKPFNLIPAEPEADDVEASVMTRFHILKCRDDRNPIIPAGKQTDRVHVVSSDDSVTESPGNSGKRTQYSLGSTDNCSSDWEHVLKEDISWR